MNVWKQTGKGSSIKDVVLYNTGLTEKEFFTPKTQAVRNLREAADRIRAAVQNQERITIVGDYDCDGVTASSILYQLIKAIGGEVRVRLPCRYSEGYGVSPSIIQEITDGLVVTVDNGIAAVEAVEEAKKQNLSVVIFDHHLPGEILPKADIIVDPYVNGDAFQGYCDAGLAFKLAQELLGASDRQFLNALAVLAAIGTIADVMPLIGDNRLIVKGGLKNMHDERIMKTYLPGLDTLIATAEIEDINETDIAFSIGPIINAAGRMRDDGAILAFELLGKNECSIAEELISINEKRKDEVAEALLKAEAVIAEECLYAEVPLCVCIPDVNEGIIGIIAGRLSEEFKAPAFVFTDTGEDLKGSGRSYGGYHLKGLLDRTSRWLTRYGGHAGAAGLSILKENYYDWKEAVIDQAADYSPSEIDIMEYDLEIMPENIEETIQELSRYAPFGEGNPRPVFLLKNFLLSPRQGSFFKVMGKDGRHIKLFGPHCVAVGFNKTDQFYGEAGGAKELDIIGMLGSNTFMNRTESQVEMKDFRKTEKPETKTGLAAILAERMKSF